MNSVTQLSFRILRGGEATSCPRVVGSYDADLSPGVLTYEDWVPLHPRHSCLLVSGTSSFLLLFPLSLLFLYPSPIICAYSRFSCVLLVYVFFPFFVFIGCRSYLKTGCCFLFYYFPVRLDYM
ncbi:hypothetical protein GDO78_020060 [Eleutherodactylus coqui]|uniref:Uncharacterized protein n=1 Tax=Eleutherodactylus coqui TaxID=57060 RepID=A0A8J6E5E4_ELECQ|nr:hypothetical protein GDO78_020060 [Eleutherodactylus coqui]